MQQQMTPEQMEELQEKLKNMSPEELAEYQKQNCIFCQIINGKVQSKKIYEDDKVIAILDINPANPGHVLLMPKEHYAILPLVPENIIEHLSLSTKKISQICLKTLGVEGTTILVANGLAAGQKAQHFMMHIIPRKENDGVGLEIPENETENLNEIRSTIQQRINELFKTNIEVPEAPPEPKTESQKPEVQQDSENLVSKESKEDSLVSRKLETSKKSQTKPKPKKKPKEKKEVNLDDIADMLK